MKERTPRHPMNKLFHLIGWASALALITFLQGCGGDGEEPASEEAKPAETAEATDASTPEESTEEPEAEPIPEPEPEMKIAIRRGFSTVPALGSCHAPTMTLRAGG